MTRLEQYELLMGRAIDLINHRPVRPYDLRKLYAADAALPDLLTMRLKEAKYKGYTAHQDNEVNALIVEAI